jgi:hypothetical protein
MVGEAQSRSEITVPEYPSPYAKNVARAPEEAQVIFQLRILEESNAASSLPRICLFWR